MSSQMCTVQQPSSGITSKKLISSSMNGMVQASLMMLYTSHNVVNCLTAYLILQKNHTFTIIFFTWFVASPGCYFISQCSMHLPSAIYRPYFPFGVPVTVIYYQVHILNFITREATIIRSSRCLPHGIHNIMYNREAENENFIMAVL